MHVTNYHGKKEYLEQETETFQAKVQEKGFPFQDSIFNNRYNH